MIICPHKLLFSMQIFLVHCSAGEIGFPLNCPTFSSQEKEYFFQISTHIMICLYLYAQIRRRKVSLVYWLRFPRPCNRVMIRNQYLGQTNNQHQHQHLYHYHLYHYHLYHHHHYHKPACVKTSHR